MAAELNDSFIEELFKAAITDKNTMAILGEHLKYHNLPTEPYKTVWKEIINFYEIEGKLPTLGLLHQNIQGVKNEEVKADCRNILANIKRAKVDNVHESLLTSFEVYKKEVEFTSLYKEVAEIYNDGGEGKAIEYMARKSAEINEFTIKNNYYARVFADIDKRMVARQARDPDHYSERITSGIHELDHYTRGGFKKGTSFLLLGRSGTGKSTQLRWHAMSAARMGKRVVIFSLEDLQEETMEAIDACWTATPLHDMEFGRLPESKIKQIFVDSHKWINEGGEIYVYCAESFDGMTIEDCARITKDIEKLHGKVDMVLFDYLELFSATAKDGGGRGDSAERRRRDIIASKITNFGIDFKCVTGSATQANDIPPALYNNPDFYMTRTHISEFKGVIKPFSYFMTINQTDDEKEQNVCRIYNDKFRKHRSGQVMKIYQRMDIARFYDSSKTLKYLWDDKIKRQIL